jgi:hypothetical protein
MFRTEIQPTRSQPIQLTDPVLTLGSCFSDVIGQRLADNKFKALVNPFGVSYNPISIHKLIRYSLHNQVVPEHTYWQTGEVICNFDFHSSLSALTRTALRESLTERIGVTHFFLKECQSLFLTYGTAWAYERNDTGDVVSNCHKVPADFFTKTLLSQKRILDDFDAMYQELMQFNPQIRIVLTVSPVRHVKDTLPLNSVSKSILRLFCHTAANQYANVVYFPSFEIMMDDLRDYRFYEADLIHPNDQANDYIWARFSDTFFDANTQAFLHQWRSIRAALAHRPFHPGTASHRKFLETTLQKLRAVSSIVNVDEEINVIQSQLS